MKRIIIICSIFVGCLSQLFAIDYVVITEIMYDTPLNEDQSKYIHNAGEFIELYNVYDNEADISGWSLETIQPKQTFNIPIGVVIPPQSALIIAYKPQDTYSSDSSNQSEYNRYKEDFCWLYGIDNLEILFQNSLILPNTQTSLVLKDANGQTRDSTLFANDFPESPLYALNNGNISASDGCLEDVFSVQRRKVNFNANGTAIYNYIDWSGWNVAYNAKEITNNSIGSITTNFWGCNILPFGDNENIETTNYIQEITPLVAMSNIDTSRILNIPSQATIKRTYYDALYRPTLTFLFNQSPNQNNLVTLQEYDVYTRPTKEWLPIVTEINHLTKNTFKSNVEQFYNTESRPFVEQTYSTETWDNGTIKNKVAGLQKAGADMNSHKTAFTIRGNNANEVKLFSVSSNGLLECNSFYPGGMLRVKQTKDEDNIAKVVYTNLRNQIVMEKVDNATTYYVYNDLNQLCYVLPHLAANQLTDGTYNDTTDVLKKYAYVYKYDNRGNQIYKRLPGCEPIVMEYDKRNLLVASQTGNQRNRGDCWIQYTYDKLCRLTRMTEINKSDGILIDTLQAGEVIGARSSTYNLIDGNNIQNVLYSSQLLITKNYDNYLHVQLLSDQIKSHMSFQAFEGNATYTTNAKGLLTGTRTYYLDGSGNYSETVYYYDYRGREIQRRSTNHLGGIDVLSTKYDFVNNITDTWSSQSTSNGLTTTEHYYYEYDHANRLLTTTYTFNNEPPIVLQSYNYDELGRVRSRHIHNSIDSVAFNYDIRNQITKIKSSGYEQKYYYNQTSSIGNSIVEPTYNGNISATTWTYGNKTNGYMYYYDKSNRLKSTYSIMDEDCGDFWYTEMCNYDAHGNITRFDRWNNQDVIDYLYLTYNGNQLVKVEDNGYLSYRYDIKQYHDNNTSGDDFAYDANGNMLYDKDRGIVAIRYNLLNLPDTIQFSNGNQIVHRYDAVGNRLETNYYTRKVTTTVPLGNTLTGTNNTTNYNITRNAYHNNVVYTANKNYAYGIEFVHNPEGYIRYLGPEEHYHFYYIKDLLGNIRETYVYPWEGYKECVQRTQYYPSGLPWVEAMMPSEQPWKYNGKEFVEMHGLDEYDSKARWYYPAICRTTTMDPLAEKYYSTSPYAWCGNNPITFIDANGCWYDFSGMTNEEKTAFESSIDILKGNSMFQRLYTELEDSPEKYSILFGETAYIDEHNVEGQFVPYRDGGGLITFLSGKEIDGSVAAEEFFHAYQQHNHNLYTGGEFNREFEAKTFVTLLIEHICVGFFEGMSDFQQNITSGVYGSNDHNSLVLYNDTFERDYLKFANIYANYNKTNNIGDYNYQRNTLIPPFSLKRLFNF